MPRSSRELWFSFFAVIGVTVVYIFMVTYLNQIPAASSFFGHSIGVTGFVLMLMTETLYSLRKRTRSARWGRMADWLDFHIFTGLVGPYMVLLHSSWKFNGLAGVVTLMTALVVISGFLGRYIYTAVPRTADGAELEAGLLRGEIQAAEAELQGFLAQRPQVVRALAHRLAADPPAAAGLGGFFLRGLSELSYRLEWTLAKSRLDPDTRRQAAQLEKLARRRRLLKQQVGALALSRRLMAVWHTVHIPIGMALFTAAFIHIGAAIYYATLMR